MRRRTRCEAFERDEPRLELGWVGIFLAADFAQVTSGHLAANNPVKMNRGVTFMAFLAKHYLESIILSRQTPEARHF